MEDSEQDPQLVFVRPMTQEGAQTNLLVTTVGGRRISLLLKAGPPDELGQATSRKVHFLLQYESSNRLVIDQASDSSVIIPETIALPSDVSKRLPKRSLNESPLETSTNLLERLLARQRRNPLPSLRGNAFRAGISEVIENGRYLSVLFSIVNPGKDRIELMPPQLQLSGAKRSGGIFRRSHPYVSEQVAVSDFRLSSRTAEANERVDGVALFEKPMFKESDQTLFLQVSTWDAVDRPVLVPIPLGMSHFTEGEFE